MTVYEDVCSCVPFAVSTPYNESVRDAFYTFAIHVGDCDSYLQFFHVGDSHLCDSGLLFFCIIIIITLWANSADNKLIFFLIFPEKRHHRFIQIVSWGHFA